MRIRILTCTWLLVALIYGNTAFARCDRQWQDTLVYPYRNMPSVYPGTSPLTWEGDLSVKMLDGAHRFIDNEIEKTVKARAGRWKRDVSSPERYRLSVEGNRKSLMKFIGIEDRSKEFPSFNVGLKEQYPAAQMLKWSEAGEAEPVAETSKYRVFQVKWPVFTRINGEGLLLQPTTTPRGFVICLPDADQLPEQLAGLQPGVAVASQFARHLAENGYEVLVPVLISRTLMFEGDPKQQTYREWLYRQAFHMGRHLIGYEVQKVMAAVDWFSQKNRNSKIAVAGYGEGGMIAFYTGAIDTRINATLVSGYFSKREKVWDEPIYRNVFGLLKEFGDAEIASLIAPRSLIVEHSEQPLFTDELKDDAKKNLEVEGLPFTGYKGKLQPLSYASVKSEFDRAGTLVAKGSLELVVGENGRTVPFGSRSALQKLLMQMGDSKELSIAAEVPRDLRKSFDASLRQRRQVKEIEDQVQELVRDADQRRKKFFLYEVMPEWAASRWSTMPYHPYQPIDTFVRGAERFRKYFSEEVIGRFEDSLLPANARTRKIYDKGRFTGYEVVLDVYNDLFATGILLIPKDLKKGERRPVVVCQHGRNDVPHKLVEGNFTAYNNVASKLADQGFVVYVPQNPYRGEDRYRWLARKANTIGKTFFSFIVAQHDQALRWLQTLPFTDGKRIAFYGLSYGGQTAMRVPAILKGYCLSICAGDFGDASRKVTDTHFEGSFMNSLEWEMPFFNMGNTFSYAEMSYLIFPRPFMVERGHHDLVQPTEWVSFEYGKVRFFYDQFGLGDKTEIEYFNGGHSMRGEGTFRFLHKHLNWP